MKNFYATITNFDGFPFLRPYARFPVFPTKKTGPEPCVKSFYASGSRISGDPPAAFLQA